jgi:hypothetical protein
MAAADAAALMAQGCGLSAEQVAALTVSQAE